MKVLFVLGSGGHTKRGLMLANELDCEKKFIVPWESGLTKQKVGKNYYSVLSPRFRAKDNRIMTVLRTLFLFLHSFLILLIERPDYMISTGSGITVPPFLLARIFRVKTVYIESPSRVVHPSISGWFLMKKVDKWLSSWPHMKILWNVDYEGMIL